MLQLTSPSFAFVEYESKRDADDAYHEMHNKRIGRDDVLKIEVRQKMDFYFLNTHANRFSSGHVHLPLLPGDSILAVTERVVLVKVVPEKVVPEKVVPEKVVPEKVVLARVVEMVVGAEIVEVIVVAATVVSVHLLVEATVLLPLAAESSPLERMIVEVTEIEIGSETVTTTNAADLEAQLIVSASEMIVMLLPMVKIEKVQPQLQLVTMSS